MPVWVQVYTALVSVLPILASYASGIPGFTVADVALVFCTGFFVWKGYRQRNNRFRESPVIMVVALGLILTFNVVSISIQEKPQVGNILIRTIRYFFYLAVVAICSIRMLDLKYLKKMVKAVSVAATVYLFIQFVLYRGFRVILRGYLPFLSLYEKGYETTDYATLYAYLFRPTSFFLEPAHYARYAVMGVTLFLFGKKTLSLKDILYAAFISVGILISTSAQGYVLLAMVLLLCLFTREKALREDYLKVLFKYAKRLLPLIILVVLQIPFVKEAVTRALDIDFSNLSNNKTALGARLGGFAYYFELPTIYKFIGMGFGVVPESGWLSSAPYWLYGSGCIIFALYLIYGFLTLRKTKGAVRIILVMFLMLFFTDDCFYNYMCVLFISLTCVRPVGNKHVRGVTA